MEPFNVSLQSVTGKLLHDEFDGYLEHTPCTFSCHAPLCSMARVADHGVFAKP